MHAHANARTRTCSREQEESQDCALSTDFGSNAERTDEVGMQGEPSWLSEIMSLISRATDRVFADETVASESESESAPRSSGWIPDWATMMTGDQPAFGPASAYVVDAGSAAVAENGAGNSGPRGAFPTVADNASYSPRGTLGEVHAAHERRLADGIELSLGMRERDLGLFQAHYERHRARYEAVSARTDIPPKLIAALHWRESSGNFNTYLHQGDPIGRPSRNHPAGILFYDWETAAIDALRQKNGVRDEIGITASTTDAAAIATYAERYNGLGYHYKGRPSPYVYAGTGEYTRGKYVADGRYSSTHVDGQLGVLAMVGSVGGLDTALEGPTPENAWSKVLNGRESLRRGSRGLGVRVLQQKLNAVGIAVGVDGDFGPATHRAVLDFQGREGLAGDGIVGRGTAARLEAAAGGSTGGSSNTTTTGSGTGTENATGNDAANGGTGSSGVDNEVARPLTDRERAWASVASGYDMLQRGSFGLAVEELQRKLTAAGVPTVVDGDFGPATRAAVINFQRRNGLGADGVVGLRTAAALDR